MLHYTRVNSESMSDHGPRHVPMHFSVPETPVRQLRLKDGCVLANVACVIVRGYLDAVREKADLVDDGAEHEAGD